MDEIERIFTDLHDFILEIKDSDTNDYHPAVDKAIFQARLSLWQAIEKGLPKGKELRTENIKREMGLDGKIIEREVDIRYDKEAESYNLALHEIKSKLKGLMLGERS